MSTKIRVALADDHEIVMNGVKGIISGFEGMEVILTGSNGQELYQKILASDILPDIVVTDISMPVWDGYETLEAVKKKWPGIKVLILTMHKHELAVIKMFRSGANGFLLKNSPPQELQKALQSIYETGLYFSEVASSNLYHRLQHSNVMPSLTEKEVTLLKYCHTDLTYKGIADKMGISERSVAGYRTTLFHKLDVNSRAGLVVCAIKMGLVAIE
ncbi:MAG: response regulator transcription factor [Bacteroidota bacterium]